MPGPQVLDAISMILEDFESERHVCDTFELGSIHPFAVGDEIETLEGRQADRWYRRCASGNEGPLEHEVVS